VSLNVSIKLFVRIEISFLKLRLAALTLVWPVDILHLSKSSSGAGLFFLYKNLASSWEILLIMVAERIIQSIVWQRQFEGYYLLISLDLLIQNHLTFTI
jgi:hypothetical protein